MPYGIPNFAAALRDTVASSRRPRRPVNEEDYVLPDTPAMDEYTEHGRNLPDYEDYKPGVGSKIAGALVGLAGGLRGDVEGGIRGGREVMDRGFVRALREHAMQGDVLREAAEAEGGRNNMRVGLLRERRMAEDSADEIALKGEANDIADRAEARLHEKMQKDFEEGGLDRASREKIAAEGAAASRYGADRSFAANKYEADQRLEGDRLQADRGFGRGPGAEKVIPIGQQDDADRLAIERVLRNNPKFMKFADEIAGKDDSDYKGYRIVPGGKVPDPHWYNRKAERDMTPEEKLDYDAFVREVEDAKRQMYGTMVDPYASRGFGRRR